jgi:hypothetical protein
MFETPILASGPSTKWVWATFADFSGQMLLVAFALLAPMSWPLAIPHVVWVTMSPAPPTPPPRAAGAARTGDPGAVPWISGGIGWAEVWTSQ